MRKNTQVGDKFGKWTVISDCNDKGRYLCKCECGTIRKVNRGDLGNGSSSSCGCVRSKSKPTIVHHGMSSHPLASTHKGMMERCYNKNCSAYKYYGGRGIRVCKRWHDIKRFIKDMEPRPVGLSIDRIDVNGDYEPSNCKWSTKEEQARNKQILRDSKLRKHNLHNIQYKSDYKKWVVQKTYKGRHFYMGSYDTVLQAINVRDAFLRSLEC